MSGLYAWEEWVALNDRVHSRMVSHRLSDVGVGDAWTTGTVPVVLFRLIDGQMFTGPLLLLPVS